jgi:hypothetical protein
MAISQNPLAVGNVLELSSWPVRADLAPFVVLFG